jgi:hypothetical protein
MNAAFGPSKIAKKPQSSVHPVITTKQLGIIQGVCFGDIDSVIYTEDNWVTAFAMLAYIPLSLFVFGRIVWLGVERSHPGSPPT